MVEKLKSSPVAWTKKDYIAYFESKPKPLSKADEEMYAKIMSRYNKKKFIPNPDLLK